MPADVDLTGCCMECYMPLHGGICAFDPEHTPLPQDLDDPELPDWFPTWLHNYQRRTMWPFGEFGPQPKIIQDDVKMLKLAPLESAGAGLPEPARRHPGAAVWEGRPLCPECLMPLARGRCPLEPGHDVRSPVLRTTERSAPSSEPRALPALRRPPSEEGAGAGGARAAAAEEELPARPRWELEASRLPRTIEAWLREMDEAGFLALYHDTIAGHFDSPAQVIDVYARFGAEGEPPSLDPRFLDEMRIVKLGHRRLFEKWFSDRLGHALTSGPPPSEKMDLCLYVICITEF